MTMKVLLAAAVVAVAVPGTAAAQRGVIVKVDRSSKLVAVASPRGAVSLVHTGRVAGLHVGQRVSYTPRALRNHTFAAKRLLVKGHAQRVHVRGIVLAKRTHGYVVSAAGAALLIKARAATRQTSSASDDSPQIGTQVDVTADCSSGDDLEAEHVTSLGAAAAARFEGRIQSIASDAIVLAKEGVQVRILVPAGFDLTAFAVGDEVLAAFSRQTDGSFVLTTISGNHDAAEADDEQEIEDGADDHGDTAEVEDSSDDHGDTAEVEDSSDDHGDTAEVEDSNDDHGDTAEVEDSNDDHAQAGDDHEDDGSSDGSDSGSDDD